MAGDAEACREEESESDERAKTHGSRLDAVG
jgi:hypothetical protein